MSKATFIYLTYEYLFHQTVYLLYMCYLVKINNKHVLCLEDSENRLVLFCCFAFYNYKTCESDLSSLSEGVLSIGQTIQFMKPLSVHRNSACQMFSKGRMIVG